MPKKVGIEAIYIYVPEFYVDNTELAIHRGTDPKHFTEGLGITRLECHRQMKTMQAWQQRQP